MPGKLAFGYATGAVSIISDGFHSLTDGASNVMGIVAMRAARKPPDEDHPYGHRKYETLAAAGIFVFLLLVVIEVVRRRIGRLRGGHVPEVTVAQLRGDARHARASTCWSCATSRARDARCKSELLLADAAHTRSDVLTSCAVLVSLLASGSAIPRSMRSAGWSSRCSSPTPAIRSACETSGILADRVVMSEDDIRRVVMGVPDVDGCHHIRTRGSDDHTFLDLHVWFPGDTTLYEAHRLSHVVKDRLMESYPQIADAIIHIEPPPLNKLTVTLIAERGHSSTEATVAVLLAVELLDLLPLALFDHLALHFERRRQLAALDRKLGRAEARSV